MTQPYARVFNFSAGPCTLPVEVLEEIRDDMMNYKGCGMSVMELSHRGKVFERILNQAVEDFRKVMEVPSDYHILFLQGGASMQNTMIPMAFLPQDKTADYVVTGEWGRKSYEAALHAGKVNLVYSGKDTNYDRAPDLDQLTYTPDSAYMHFTSNETIQGVDFRVDPSLKMNVVGDVSSNILSRPIDVSKYSLLYAGAQKNMGPAGATVVILKDEFLQIAPKEFHPMLDYRLHVKNGSMYNTPPCWSIYVCGLVYQWVIREGGTKEMQRRNEEKAAVLYHAIDDSGGFYKGHAQTESRSLMNITFTLPSEDLTDRFVKEAEAEGLDGLKGHRSVGGVRASIYNAFPKSGCETLASFMRLFAAKNG